MLEAIPLFGPMPGGTEMLVVLLIAVLLFGANKIPKLARSTGQAMGEFQKGREQVEQELEEIQEGGSSSESGSEPESGHRSSSAETAQSSEETSETDTATETQE